MKQLSNWKYFNGDNRSYEYTRQMCSECRHSTIYGNFLNKRCILIRLLFSLKQKTVRLSNYDAVNVCAFACVLMFLPAFKCVNQLAGF